jgi:hypothetical protein
MIESGFVGSPAILFGSITRKTYNHDCRHCGDRSESPGNFVAVNFGQTDVEDYKFRAKRTPNEDLIQLLPPQSQRFVDAEFRSEGLSVFGAGYRRHQWSAKVRGRSLPVLASVADCLIFTSAMRATSRETKLTFESVGSPPKQSVEYRFVINFSDPIPECRGALGIRQAPLEAF